MVVVVVVVVVAAVLTFFFPFQTAAGTAIAAVAVGVVVC